MRVEAWTSARFLFLHSLNTSFSAFAPGLSGKDAAGQTSSSDRDSTVYEKSSSKGRSHTRESGNPNKQLGHLDLLT
jgi:hypothetical protein